MNSDSEVIKKVHGEPGKIGDVVPEDYVVSDNELNNLVYLICKYTVGWAMREADFFIVKSMVGSGAGPDFINKVIEMTTEMLWDHMCGEPDHFSPKDLQIHIVPVLKEWYSKTNRTDRENVQ